MADVPHTDVSRPSALPTAKLARRRDGPDVDKDSDEYLSAVEEDWNRKIDADVDTLVDGMTDLVHLASIGDKDKFAIAQEAFQAQCRAESMKLLLLLSDEAQIANRRDAELKVVQQERDLARKEAAALLDQLLKPATT